MDYILHPTFSLMLAVLVLYTGRLLNKISLLTKYNIPEPVAGGCSLLFFILFIQRQAIPFQSIN